MLIYVDAPEGLDYVPTKGLITKSQAAIVFVVMICE